MQTWCACYLRPDRSSGGASSGADATLPLPPASRDWVVGDRGLGKLLIVAPDQALARSYLATVRSWLPPGVGEREAMLATSSERDAHETIAAFRLLPSPSILVTVAMAYEGLDAPEVSVIACLTHIRSRPWLEQMIARATRVDPHAGPVERARPTCSAITQRDADGTASDGHCIGPRRDIQHREQAQQFRPVLAGADGQRVGKSWRLHMMGQTRTVLFSIAGRRKWTCNGEQARCIAWRTDFDRSRTGRVCADAALVQTGARPRDA